MQASSAPASLGPALNVNGDVFSSQDLVVAARVRGSIDIPDRALTILAGADVRGPLFARIITIAGSVVGDVTASDRIELQPGAQVEGDLVAPTLIVDEGAKLTGRVDMKRSEAAIRVARYRLDKRTMPTAG